MPNPIYSPQDPEWLFMVYMVAGDGDQLDNLAVQDLLEMERGIAANSPGNVEVWAQVRRRWPSQPQRYRIRHAAAVGSSESDDVVGSQNSPRVETKLDRQLTREHIIRRLERNGIQIQPDKSRPAPKDPNVNMGERDTLLEFLVSAPRARRYCLVLWGHAFGLGFGRDHGDPLLLHELESALSEFKKCGKRKGLENRHVHVLGGNTCTLSYVEAIYQLRECAEFLVGSEVFVPFAGWPYESILREVTNQEPQALGQLIVRQYLDFYNRADRDERVAMTLTRLGKDAEAHLTDLKEGLEDLAKLMNGALSDAATKSKLKRDIQDTFLVNPAGETRPLLDLHSLADDLGKLGATSDQSLQALQSPACKLDVALSKLMVKCDDQSKPSADREQTTALNGIGVFAPFVVDRRRRIALQLEPSDSNDESAARKRTDDAVERYRNLAIFQDSKWPSLVTDLLRLDEPDEIVDSLGEIKPRDRSDLSLLALGVDAAFRRLKAVAKSTKGGILEQLKDKPRSHPGQIARFGPPILKLANAMNLRARLPEKPQQNATPESQQTDTPDSETGNQIAMHLRSLELALTRVEFVTRSALTDSRFGIGVLDSPVKAIGFAKPAGEGFHNKPAGEGFNGGKSAGEGFNGGKSAGEGLSGRSVDQLQGAIARIGSEVVFATSNAEIGSLAVLDLFQQAARALRHLEDGCAAIEGQVGALLRDPKIGEVVEDRDYPAVIRSIVINGFDTFDESVTQSHRAIRAILFHPTYGIGPGPVALPFGAREALAIQAGLSRHNLRLL
jgi:hypothetical protein